MKGKKLAYLVLLLVLAFAIYWKTLLPGLGYTGDTAKFQYIGKILGVPHAPGYPLYVLLNHFFTFLPIKTLAFRANLMSAVFSVLTLLVLFYLIQLLVKKEEISLLATLYFAFTYAFWSQSLVAEVYSLNAFFTVLVLFLLVKWSFSKKKIFFYSFLFVYALSLGNHLTIITIFPAILVFVLLVDPKILFKLKSIVLTLSALLIGAGQYSYLYIRTLQNAPYLEHRVYTFKDLLNVITARQFREKMFAFSFQEVILERVPMFFKMLWQELTIVGVFIGIVGLFFLFKRNKKIFLLLFLSACGEIVYFINYNIEDIQGYLIPISLIFIVFAAWGMLELGNNIKIKTYRLLFYLLLFALVIYLASSNFQKFSWKKDIAFDKSLSALFEYIPRQAIIVTDEYLDLQFVNYKALIEYPEKEIIRILVNSKKDIPVQLLTRLVVILRDNKDLQKKFQLEEEFNQLKNFRPELTLLRIQYLFRTRRELQEKFLSHVYFFSENLNASLQAQKIKTAPVLVFSKKDHRKYIFFRVFLY